MSIALQAPDSQEIERVLLTGDLGKLTPDQRLSYYNRVCESLGLNPLTKPFLYLNLNGKTVLYASKDCTEQLRKNHTVSVRIMSREETAGCYVVTAQAVLPSGRCDESIGAVNIENLKGENRSNALMKAETKAKRRVTLSICGLGMLDESEVDSIPGAMFPDQGSREAQQEVAQRRIKELEAVKDKTKAFVHSSFPDHFRGEDAASGREEAHHQPTPPAVILELANSLDIPSTVDGPSSGVSSSPKPTGGGKLEESAQPTYEDRQVAIKNEAEAVIKETKPKETRKRGPISFKALKAWGEIKAEILKLTGTTELYYKALAVGGYSHADEISGKDEAAKIWKALKDITAELTPKAHDLTLEQELERHRREHPKFMDKLGAYGFESIPQVIERATGAELGLLLAELRQR